MTIMLQKLKCQTQWLQFLCRSWENFHKKEFDFLAQKRNISSQSFKINKNQSFWNWLTVIVWNKSQSFLIQKKNVLTLVRVNHFSVTREMKVNHFLLEREMRVNHFSVTRKMRVNHFSLKRKMRVNHFLLERKMRANHFSLKREMSQH